MKWHVFCNRGGVYMVCTCKLSEPDLSTLMPKHVTHKLQNDFFIQEAVSDHDLSLTSDKVSPVWTLLIMSKKLHVRSSKLAKLIKMYEMSINVENLSNQNNYWSPHCFCFSMTAIKVWEFLLTLMLYLHDLSGLAPRELVQTDIKQYPNSRKLRFGKIMHMTELWQITAYYCIL